MTLDEMIEVLQAAKAGKKIQFKGIGTEWLDSNPNDWNFSRWTYRIKPEPRVIYVNEYEPSSLENNRVCTSLAMANMCQNPHRVRVVKFIEVIE